MRVLGASKNVRIPSTALILRRATIIDLWRFELRAVRIRLDAKCERPDERRFDRDRTNLHCGTFRARCRRVDHSPGVPVCGAPSQASPMGICFEDSSDTVRWALIWLGMGDCRGDIDALRADDPEKAELAEIIDALPTAGSRSVILRIASREPSDARGFRGLPSDVTGAFATSSFGRYCMVPWDDHRGDID